MFYCICGIWKVFLHYEFSDDELNENDDDDFY